MLIESRPLFDERGCFLEIYKQSPYKEAGIAFPFVQDNYSVSKKGTLRGIHYQWGHAAQGKLIRVLHGKTYAVAVDLRQSSPFYGKWISVTLSGGEATLLWIPEGFGHGFLSLEENTEVLYKVTREYAPELERGIVWNDPVLKIPWPIPNPTVSDKDRTLPRFEERVDHFG